MREKQGNRRDLHARLLSTQQEMHAITSEIKEYIKTLVQEVEGKVCSALTEEIRRLNILVNDYDKPFNPEAHFLEAYKKELHSHVEKGLGMNLRARLSAALSGQVETASKHMEGRVIKAIGGARAIPSDIQARSNFEVFYRLNCESLCADFQEDLEFRFSLGLISLIKRFSNRSPFRKETVPRPISSPPAAVIDGQLISSSLTDNESLLLMMIERSAVIAPHTHNLGALALGGFMVKTIGWKIIGGICAVYALLYAYERATWNNRTKERAFKKQYVVHATRKLKLIIDLTSANCSHQIQQ
jgi:mitofusin